MTAPRAYYNEHDPHAAQWLRNLIDAGEIAPGVVDERDIRDVRPDDLTRFTQCHFFAGLGVWSFALRQAGWPDDRPVWTGSCPCQPFSAAGKGAGFDDERHLWPAWEWLIRHCRPDTIFGEQVASKDGLSWFDLVLSDLQGSNYAVGVRDSCAAGVGAPHIRQRLFFVADAEGERHRGRSPNIPRPTSEMQGTLAGQGQGHAARADGAVVRIAHTESIGLLGRSDDGDGGRRELAPRQGCEAGDLGDANGAGLALRSVTDERCGALWDEGAAAAASGDLVRLSPTNGFWRDADWLGCTDGKWRQVEPGSFPLVDGSAFKLGSGGAFEGKSRAKMLRGYGNAIVAPLAAEFICAFLDAELAQ